MEWSLNLESGRPRGENRERHGEHPEGTMCMRGVQGEEPEGSIRRKGQEGQGPWKMLMATRRVFHTESYKEAEEYDFTCYRSTPLDCSPCLQCVWGPLRYEWNI